MPYIKKNEREALKDNPSNVFHVGQLNYMITMAAMEYLSNYNIEKLVLKIRSSVVSYKKFGNTKEGYIFINDVIGAMTASMMEIDRRLRGTKSVLVLEILEKERALFYKQFVAPYEDKKIKENGDVFSEEDLQS